MHCAAPGRAVRVSAGLWGCGVWQGQRCATASVSFQIIGVLSSGDSQALSGARCWHGGPLQRGLQALRGCCCCCRWGVPSGIINPLSPLVRYCFGGVCAAAGYSHVLLELCAPGPYCGAGGRAALSGGTAWRCVSRLERLLSACTGRSKRVLLECACLERSCNAQAVPDCVLIVF